MDEQEDESCFGVFEENWSTVEMFLRLSSQWNWVGSMGGAGCVGLNYQSVDFLFRLYKIPKDERVEMFEGIRIMETAALNVFNQKEQ